MNREDFLKAAGTLPVKKVSIPDVGDVYVRTMTAADADQMEALLVEQTKSKKHNVRALFVCFGMCDEQGNRLFSLDDLDQLSKLSTKVMNAVFEASVEMNKYTKTELEIYEKN